VNVHFHPRGTGPEQYVAEAEIHFGPETPLLHGTKLVGFLLWERRDGRIEVVVPSRSWGVGSYRQTFELLRPIDEDKALPILQTKRRILDAWKVHVAAKPQEGS
jgi:hypothetical protein